MKRFSPDQTFQPSALRFVIHDFGRLNCASCACGSRLRTAWLLFLPARATATLRELDFQHNNLDVPGSAVIEAALDTMKASTPGLRLTL
jgi:hypothetical protein